MTKFKDMVGSADGSRFILQGNQAFALGVLHAGYHCAEGYPGTPSTEIIDKSLSKVQDKILVGWDVNEAVAVAVGVGHAVAGFDTVVTMKTPGAFQAGDTITTSAFYNAPAGALVLFVATDYAPSSTQHVIDLRHFFAAARVPVLEPKNHQDMYEIAAHAADISKEFNTPVVILANGILCHSEGLITTKETRTVNPRELTEDLKPWMNMPNIARAGYNHATQVRIPGVEKWAEKSSLNVVNKGTEDWGIIVAGESYIMIKEALKIANLNPSILALGTVYPLPEKLIKEFTQSVKGNVFLFEDGDKFIQDKVTLMGVDVIGKEENSVITDYNPEMILELLSKHIDIKIEAKSQDKGVKPVSRPPAICPGCPYRAFGLTVSKLRKQKKIYSSFGDIGCSTLLYFENAIDTCLCMGGSDSMRQGFVLSRPEYASKTISVLGDSCECHSGLDATRNAVFRNTPGVKIVLDNRITAMTGGQPAPSSACNLAGVPNKFNLKKVLEAEEARVVAVDSYDLKAVEVELKKSLELAEQGEFTTMVLEGPCMNMTPSSQKKRTLHIDMDKCIKCGKCNICPGIEFDKENGPRFTSMCTNCGGNTQVCMQRCPAGAIVEEIIEDSSVDKKQAAPAVDSVAEINKVVVDKNELPDSLRVAIRGIGGQGNLFFGKVLSTMMMNTPYKDSHIVKGDTHGMAQLGGPVISTFACGDVYSPNFAPHSADVLVAMEMSEVLRPGFLDLLKPGGVILFNKYRALPPNTKIEDYPKLEDIKQVLEAYQVIEIDALEISSLLGDKSGKSSNVAVLGVLSTIEPFNKIPEEIWVDALMKLSPNDGIKAANQIAFKGGREYVK
ncbi:MAG: 2-oxoacid:acceptor oxidoreductase family protein [Bacteroidales bacterium]|nr:2-oxoacid:acceptor oxidoreductase family protein [Bacteroidales bacterium]